MRRHWPQIFFICSHCVHIHSRLFRPLASSQKSIMRMNYLIIISTTIAFGVVASEASNLEENDGSTCYETVQETQTRITWNSRICDNLKYDQRLYELCKSNGQNERHAVPYVRQTCCLGYQKKNSKCVPRCSPACKSTHYCAYPNECRCNPELNEEICNGMVSPSTTEIYDVYDNDKRICGYGWNGKSCSESLYCVIIEPAREDTDRVQRYRQKDILTLKNRTECLPTCLTSQAVNFVHYGNMKYYFVPIESPCNNKADFKYQLIGSIGIVLLVICIICIVWLIGRNRRPGTAKMDGETANIEYDDVANLSEEPVTQYQYDYVYDHRLPGRQMK